MNAVEIDRDRRRRRDILTSLKLAMGTAPRAGLSGRAVIGGINEGLPDDQRIDGDEHAIRLIRELESAGYVTTEIRGLRRGQAFGLSHVDLVKITDKGQKLWAEELPADPLVDDDRIEL